MIAENPPGGASPRSDLPGFHVLVPVWGAAYCDLFTGLSLPSQLARGNLPALPHKDRCLYQVLTRPEDRARIEQSDAWRALAALMPARIDAWMPQERTPHDIMSAYLRRGIEQADARDAASLFFNPDLVFADGAIEAMVRRVAGGSRVIFTTGVRLRKDTAAPEIEGHRQSAAITLAPRELASIALRNLHPISRQNFWTGDGTLLPATLFWPAGDDGFLARCFHLHPLLVWPQRKNVFFAGTVDDDFVSMACPHSAADHVVTDSDELLMCEISDSLRLSETPYRKGSIGDVVDWAESHTDARHRRLATFPIRFHAKDVSGPAWVSAEAESARVIDEVLRRLHYGWLRVMLRSPTRLLRRWVRLAATASTSQRNHPDADAWRGSAANWYLGLYRRYGAFCAAYENARKRLDRLLFGPTDNPYPWSENAFVTAIPVKAALSAVADLSAPALIIAAPADVRRRLASAFQHPTVFDWTDANTDWPFASLFDALIYAGPPLTPSLAKAFLSEFLRLTGRNGRAVIVTPTDQLSNDVAPLLPTESDKLTIERRFTAGGAGSMRAERVYRWCEDRRRIYRISPVIFEIPLLPFILALRLFTGVIAAIGVKIADRFDRDRASGYTVTILTRSDR